MLEVKDLRKRYGSVTAVDGVSLRAGRGETVGLLGPNGAGKTSARVVFGVHITGSMAGFLAVCASFSLMTAVFGTLAVMRFRWEAES